MTQDHLTPEQIENAHFPESPHGYEQAHVDAFLRTMAQQVRDLHRMHEIAELKSTKPFEAAGKEMGGLLQQAYQVSETARKEAKRDASTTVQAARKEADRLKSQAEEILTNARRQADEHVSKAKREADDLRERVVRFRAHAEAEASVIKQEAQRQAGHIISTAKRKAVEASQSAARKADERKRELELKVVALKEHEQALRQKLSSINKQVHVAEQAPVETTEA